MDKQLKSELAKMFAPQLRFNKKIKKEEDFITNPTESQRRALKKILESNQNKTEKFFPCSVEHFSEGMFKHSEGGKKLRLRLIVRKKGVRFNDSSGKLRDVLNLVHDFETTGFTSDPTANPPKKFFSVLMGNPVNIPGLPEDVFEVPGSYLVTDIPNMKIRIGKPPEELEFRPTDVISEKNPRERGNSDNHFWSYIVGYERFPGQKVEKTPIYYHIFPHGDSTPGGIERYHVQYWFLYSFDTKTIGEINSHRSDWEHVGFDVERDPTEVRITKGFFYGHGHVLEVPHDKIEFVEGTHPVVYVAQGSHASYPKAGVAFDYRLLQIPDLSDIFRLPDKRYDDIFTGLGLKMDGWKNLIDLGENIPRIKDETTKGFRVDESQRQGPAWLEYPGYWGPDLDPGTALDVGIIDDVTDILSGRSARGPAFKSSWNNPDAKESIRINWKPRGGVISAEFSDFSGIHFFPKA